MDDVLAITVGVAVLMNFVAALVVASTPMGRVRRAAARGRVRAQREYSAFLGWLLVLLFGGPVVVICLFALLFSWPEPWRAPDVMGWAMLFGTLVTGPGVLAVAVRLTAEAARSDGPPFAPRCPVSCSRPGLP
jgi:hypothetical protein